MPLDDEDTRPSHVPPGAFSRVEDAELAYLGTNRAAAENASSLRGVAISGGGIRAASFGLGVLQALVARRYLSKVDYLSTVSGGGYIGSSLTWFLHKELSDGQTPGTDPENFPFGRALPGRKVGGGALNRALDYVRQHGNYLLPGRGLNSASLLAVLLRAVVVSVFIYGGLLVASFGLLKTAGLFGSRGGSDVSEPAWTSFLVERLEQAASVEPNTIDQAITGTFPNPMLALAAVGVVFFVVVSLLYGVSSSFKSLSRFYTTVRSLSLDARGASYALRTGAQRCFGALLGGIAAITVLGLLPLVYDALHRLSDVGDGMLGVGGAAGGSILVGSVLGLLQARAQQSESARSGWVSWLRLYAGVALLLFGVLVGAFAIADSVPLLFSLGVGGIALAAGLFTNLNYLSLHRMYRDRLMETFMPGRDNVKTGAWALAKEADELNVEHICAPPNQRPYHLINTNIVLVGSSTAKYRGRGGDSFTLSRLYCGSEATGWCCSDLYMKRSTRGMTLPTAMAISGAAANPDTGVAGRGATRSRLVSILMSLLNLRLGYWASNPRTGSLYVPPNFLRPGLPALFGRGLTEHRSLVELTDGGHFENLGLYELVRRRVGTIIVSDAGCDGSFDFGDLANAVERVRVDFGVKISFDDPEVDLRGLRPGSARPTPPGRSGGEIDLAERGFAVGTIHYPADESRGLHQRTGVLYYLKTSLISGLPHDLYGYKLSHPAFPHETTADQFFSEDQFEAYRELGYHIGEQLFDSAHGKGLGA